MGKRSKKYLGFNYPWAINIENDDITETNANFSDSNDPWDNLYKATTPVGFYNGENGTVDSPSSFGAYPKALFSIV